MQYERIIGLDNCNFECNHAAMSEEDLIEAAKKGDLNAFNQIREAHEKIFISCVGQYSAVNPSLADEMLSAKHSRIWEAIHEYDPSKGSKFSTFLYNKLRWEFLNKNKAERVRKCIHFEDLVKDNGEWAHESLVASEPPCEASFSLTGSNVQTPIEQVARQELLEKIRQHLENEDERTRTIMALKYTQKPDGHYYTLQEIAKAVNLSHQGVKNVHDRFVAKMRSIYQ